MLDILELLLIFLHNEPKESEPKRKQYTYIYIYKGRDLNWECIHVSSDCHKRRSAGADPSPNTSLGQRVLVANLHAIQLLSDQLAGLELFESKLRVFMNPPP